MIDPKSKIHVIDSHTAGEPTRAVIAGGPDLGEGTVAQRSHVLQTQYDTFRSTVVNEPRGSDELVGALLCEPTDSSCASGAIFFNNVGYLGMCGHATIGVIATLAHQGRVEPGEHRLETPVGVVTTWLHESGEVTFRNIPCYRVAKDYPVLTERFGEVVGDVAWGGNWFFLVGRHSESIEASNIDQLTIYAKSIQRALADVAEINAPRAVVDHIELFGPPSNALADSKNFVLCPGGAYDRSPCGTGVSAKLACLFADGKLAEGETWRQEGILGSSFDGYVTLEEGNVLPHITGSAYITGEAVLYVDDRDPFGKGIRR
jgi:4-hydroxyproline epimerase